MTWLLCDHALMKRLGLPHIALIPLLGASPAIAQMQSITTYGGGAGIQTTTISPTYGGGYNYTTFGGPNSGSWGGVSASPGTAVQAAVGPHGNVVPIVSTVPASVVAPAPDPALVSAQIAAANAQELAADFQLLQSLPATRHGAPPVRVARAIPVDQNTEVNTEFVSLFGRIRAKDRRAQFWRDFQADFPTGSATNFPTRAALPYLKLWLRDHEISPSQ